MRRFGPALCLAGRPGFRAEAAPIQGGYMFALAYFHFAYSAGYQGKPCEGGEIIAPQSSVDKSCSANMSRHLSEVGTVRAPVAEQQMRSDNGRNIWAQRPDCATPSGL